MNGIFNSRVRMSQAEMFEFVKTLVSTPLCPCPLWHQLQRHVEASRVGAEDLFHLPIDELADFLARNISRHFVIRHDYGLYEYTAYVYRDPSAPEQRNAKRLI